MQTPVDPTKTEAWHKLSALHDAFVPDLRGAFDADPQRAEKYSFTAAELFVDLSKNLIDRAVLKALVDLAEEVGVPAHRDAMFAGERINVTENRSVLHTALRRPKGDVLEVDGVNVVEQVHEVLDAMYAFADRVRSGEWVGVTGKKITTVINIGIGGSDLGPVMVYEALKPYVEPGLEAVGHHEGVAVYAVEPLGDIARQLQMLLLVDAHGYEVGIVDEDVSRHEHRIGKQARVDILRMPGTLFLKLVHTRQLAEGRAA